MKILVIGAGGREHALVDCISKSQKVSKIYAAPGNAGIAEQAECIDLAVDNIEGILSFCKSENIDRVVIGPELPLTLGLSDELLKENIKVFGVNKEAAQLEGSKAFTKEFLEKYNIPTAKYKEFKKIEDAKSYIESISYPTVIKADGLAAGKGVYICQNKDQADSALKEIFLDRKFGESGDKIIIEDFLDGWEISAFAFSDGNTALPLIYAQDYKKIYEGDKGSNTGGMGSYTPVSMMTEELQNKIYNEILKKTIDSLKAEGIEYQGILFAGLMIKDNEAKVLEFNVRFGDPETQVILPLLETDIIDVFGAIDNKNLEYINLEWSSKKAICVVLASEGYPESYEKGFTINGFDEAKELEGLTIYHAGTMFKDNDIVTAGGRVLNIVSLNDTLEKAHNNVYIATELVQFQGKYYRKDIAGKEIKEI